MGIPAYFSFIIKHHPEIMRHFVSDEWDIDNLYLDSNSIIYDIIQEHKNDTIKLNVANNDFSLKQMYSKIIALVIQKIEFYIRFISPKSKVFIAFDGVAPVAKLNQQRQRRHKSALEITIANNDNNINTAFITPGTQFMKMLNDEMSEHFKINHRHNIESEFEIDIILSGSNIAGEGEHKIFSYIRENPEYHKKTRTVIYGLDADLIILCLNHLPISSNIFLYRETPSFIKSMSDKLSPEKQYMLDIPLFAKKIYTKLYSNIKQYQITTFNFEKDIHFIYDYIFMSFFLGNDFMPHFPAINIRTNGIDHILDTYSRLYHLLNLNNNNSIQGLFIKHIEKNNTCATGGVGVGIQINWKNVSLFISLLAEKEDEWIYYEYINRNKYEIMLSRKNTEELTVNDTPILNRETEKYISPDFPNWQQRYYMALFKTNSHADKTIHTKYIGNISLNYLEGLEWCMKYYTVGCPDWRWSYKYYYPPLLEDLKQYVPVYNECLFGTERETEKPINEWTQLAYVLPQTAWNLLPPFIAQKMRIDTINEQPISQWFLNIDKLKNITQNKELYYAQIYEWSYCRYLWEAHIILPELNLEKLEKYILNIL